MKKSRINHSYVSSKENHSLSFLSLHLNPPLSFDTAEPKASIPLAKREKGNSENNTRNAASKLSLKASETNPCRMTPIKKMTNPREAELQISHG